MRPHTPAEAALCFEPRANIVTRIRHPNMLDLAIASCTHGRPMQSCDRCRLDVGWARLRASLSSYRWASRCRMRGARGDLHSPKDAWTPQPHGIRPYRRGMTAASRCSCQQMLRDVPAVDSQAPIYPVTRAEVGFRCAVEGSPAARADDAAAWAYIRRAEQLAPRALPPPPWEQRMRAAGDGG